MNDIFGRQNPNRKLLLILLQLKLQKTTEITNLERNKQQIGYRLTY